jgi:hypothetical protein
MEADMSRTSSITEWLKRGGLFLVASSIVLTGCQTARLTYKGAKVRDAYRISLADGTRGSAFYRSADLIVDYHVLRNGDELQLSGVAEYTAKIKNGYTLVPYLYLRVFLIDQHGYILEEKAIRTPGSDDPNNRMRFSEKIPLPPGTAGMAFSYSGEARSGGGRQDGGGGPTPFWEVPIVN